MQPSNSRLIPLLCILIFAVSGFSGLIYESIWSHYLKLFLGHAAYAQTLVIAIFMGGMAIGSWIAAVRVHRIANPLMAYAAIEGLIGLAALLFHRVFLGLSGFVFDSVIPGLGAPWQVELTKWSVAAALVLPQSIALGMTFPLMSAGIMRLVGQGNPSTISDLYFSNSLGAGIGVLVSGFVLISVVGLPGSALTAGLINIFIAIVVYGISKYVPSGVPSSAPGPSEGLSASASAASKKSAVRLLLWASALTGFASFAYEIVFMRMLSLVLGSSTHSFELMLSAFILGLAFGSLWIKSRLARGVDTARALVLVQLVMGIVALAALAFYGQTFALIEVVFSMVQRSSSGYSAYAVASYVIAASLLLPPAFLAGMTLPLITHALIERGQGEASVGKCYAWNAAGSIAGVFATSHLLLPAFGLKYSLVLASAIDMAVGVALLVGLSVSVASRFRLVLPLAGFLLVFAAAALVRLDDVQMSAAVFRTGKQVNTAERANSKVLFNHDGKSATITVTEDGVVRAIRTNAKPDAAINMKDPSKPTGDEATMTLLGAMPLLVHEKAKSVAVIGMGSGMSTHVVLGSPVPQSVHTIEIEASVFEGAKLFAPMNSRAYADPRSKLIVDDAKSHFSASREKYDLIISEPSNPWVSGVAGLFSEEFYGHVKAHLQPSGVLVQWMHVYEMNPLLLYSVINALQKSFPIFDVYRANDGDLLLIAAKDQRRLSPAWPQAHGPAFFGDLRRIGVTGPDSLAARWAGSEQTLGLLAKHSGVPANSDFFPYLDQNAARARFMGESAIHPVSLDSHAPVASILGKRFVAHTPLLALDDTSGPSRISYMPIAIKVRDAILTKRTDLDFSRVLLLDAALLESVLRFAHNCEIPTQRIGHEAFQKVMTLLNSNLGTDDLKAVWGTLRGKPCFKDLAPRTRDLVDLSWALANQDHRQMAALAKAFLDTKPDDPALLSMVLLYGGLAGILSGGQADAAQAIALFEVYLPQASRSPDLATAISVAYLNLREIAGK